MLAITIVASWITTNAQCPQSNTGPCTGVCVGVYGSGGTIDYYICSTGETAAPKDCTPSAASSDLESL